MRISRYMHARKNIALLSMIVLFLMAMSISKVHAPFSFTGTLFATTGTGDVMEIDSAGTLVGTHTVSTLTILGITVDASGFLIIADFQLNKILRVDTAFASITTLVTTPGTYPAAGPRFLAYDAAGNLYITDMSGDIYVYDGALHTFDTGLGASVSGLAFDSAGNLYVATSLTTITKYTGLTGAPAFGYASKSTFVTGAYQLWGSLAIDSAGNVFAVDQTGVVRKFTPAGVGSVFATLPVLSIPAGLTFDATGNLYEADRGNTIREYNPAGTQVFSVGPPTIPIFTIFEDLVIVAPAPPPDGFVIPEYPFGTFVGLLASFVALLVFVKYRRFAPGKTL